MFLRGSGSGTIKYDLTESQTFHDCILSWTFCNNYQHIILIRYLFKGFSVLCLNIDHLTMCLEAFLIYLLATYQSQIF